MRLPYLVLEYVCPRCGLYRMAQRGLVHRTHCAGCGTFVDVEPIGRALHAFGATLVAVATKAPRGGGNRAQFQQLISRGWCTLQRAAAILGVEYSYAAALVTRANVPKRRVDRALLVSESKVRALAESRRQAEVAP